MSRALSLVARRIKPAVFAELEARIGRLAARGEELIPLQIGDTHLPPPEGARRILGSLDPEDASLHRYGATAGLGPLREAMARALVRHGLQVDAASERSSSETVERTRCSARRGSSSIPATR